MINLKVRRDLEKILGQSRHALGVVENIQHMTIDLKIDHIADYCKNKNVSNSVHGSLRNHIKCKTPTITLPLVIVEYSKNLYMWLKLP